MTVGLKSLRVNLICCRFLPWKLERFVQRFYSSVQGIILVSQDRRPPATASSGSESDAARPVCMGTQPARAAARGILELLLLEVSSSESSPPSQSEYRVLALPLAAADPDAARLTPDIHRDIIMMTPQPEAPSPWPGGRGGGSHPRKTGHNLHLRLRHTTD